MQSDKEQILKNKIKTADFVVMRFTENQRWAVYSAMDEYAEARAIEFADWIVREKYFRKFNSEYWGNDTIEAIVNLTTDQLYKLFDEQTKQKP